MELPGAKPRMESTRTASQPARHKTRLRAGGQFRTAKTLSFQNYCLLFVAVLGFVVEGQHRNQDSHLIWTKFQQSLGLWMRNNFFRDHRGNSHQVGDKWLKDCNSCSCQQVWIVLLICDDDDDGNMMTMKLLVNLAIQEVIWVDRKDKWLFWQDGRVVCTSNDDEDSSLRNMMTIDDNWDLYHKEWKGFNQKDLRKLCQDGRVVCESKQCNKIECKDHRGFTHEIGVSLFRIHLES